ncbi:aromatic amino acid lyase [Permianibacter sp. IMCC34836]|uniref:HAL/PAL/TAL family ammonia-lyase n=1 Tax=Permianibacter fluminis TaxID=2738515 RepID=UPI0015560106|nr:aromatic amino acid ammonia-lyase [Permianibacter fluminis]NQD35547.1 aromatic amino acid lyase [Permianibacter fluminis]
MTAATEQGFAGSRPPVLVGGQRLTIEQLCAVAERQQDLQLNLAQRALIDQGADFLRRYLADSGIIYGVTTGYGDSVTTTVPAELVQELPLHLTRYHGCGLGRYLDPVATRAVLVARLNSLAHGFSGVRWELLERLQLLIEKNWLPLIPEEGSVGASGDLTPLSYVAAALVGERDLLVDGQKIPAAELHRQHGLAPLKLAPKEGLAIMNGTAVMTALAALAYQRAEYLSQLCSRITALASLTMQGNRGHFDPRLFAVKPHAGQQLVAERIWNDLAPGQPEQGPRLQDRYSIRCAPHVIGVLQDALSWMRRDIENELNSANDNPIIDSAEEAVLHGGHFYGGHIAFVMDSMKTAVANLADLLDRQLALLVDRRYNHGLPHNLSGAHGSRAAINHGLKAVQIGASAWTAEALKLTMPASVFSRSTECHNQDKVSMGTIAARDCLRTLELTEQVAASLLMAVAQAYDLRTAAGELSAEAHAPALTETVVSVRQFSGFISEDRMLEFELRALTAAVQQRQFRLYSV